MTPVNWTPEARSRLEDIEAYIAKDSPAAAQEMVQRILGRTRQLEIAPRSGRPVPDYQQEDLRELLERPYRIIYQVGAERIAILTVMHYRRLLPRKAAILKASEKSDTPASTDTTK
jgi:plasmid stabilization system protein ParE